MTRVPATALLATLLGTVATRATAQVGEIQLGVVGAYSSADGRGAGAGLAAGASIGRLVYTGLRWVRYEGTQRSVDGGAPADVRDQVQTWSVDVGIVIPVGPIEVIPGVGLGAVQFRQEVDPATGTPWAGHVWEFAATPGIALEIYAGPIAFFPEVQWVFSGTPTVGAGKDAVPYAVQPNGPVASLRITYHFDVGRFLR